MSQRQAVTKEKALAYRSADRVGKTRILDELVDLTGWHRDYARAALREALVIKPVKPRKPRARVYGDDLLPALIHCWVLLRAPAGKILAPSCQSSSSLFGCLCKPSFRKGCHMSVDTGLSGRRVVDELVSSGALDEVFAKVEASRVLFRFF